MTTADSTRRRDRVAALGPDFLNADYLIESFGTAALIGIVAVIFIETGLLFPFLPGDSLLFTAGAARRAGRARHAASGCCACCSSPPRSSGDQIALPHRPQGRPQGLQQADSRFFKQKYIDQTYAYFDKYGGRTIIVARFVPFVRTYAPVAAGVGKMRYRHFVSLQRRSARCCGASA